MNKHRRSLLLGFATLALAGCASEPDLSHLADSDVDFHSYRTFAFSPTNANPSLIDRRLLAAARSQLERRGYAFDDLAPDLLVNIVAVVEERQGPRTTLGGGASPRTTTLAAWLSTWSIRAASRWSGTVEPKAA